MHRCLPNSLDALQTSFLSSKDCLLANTRPVVERVPNICRFYCCLCCYYRRRKSIGVLQDNKSILNDSMDESGISIGTTVAAEEFKRSATQSTQSLPMQSTEETSTPPSAPLSSQASPFLKSTREEVGKCIAQEAEQLNTQSTELSKSNPGNGLLSTSLKTGNLGISDSSAIVSQNNISNECSTPTTTLIGTLQSVPDDMNVGSEIPAKWSTNELCLIEDIPDVSPSPTGSLTHTAEQHDTSNRPSSVLSKTESIETQMEDGITLPRSQSMQSFKSLVIEEELDGGLFNSLSIADSIPEHITAQPTASVTELEESIHKIADDVLSANLDVEMVSTPTFVRVNSPTIEEVKSQTRNSAITKSLESLMYERPNVDNSTETSSQCSQVNNAGGDCVPTKSQYTPLRQKSKTSCFLKNSRRVSPVKQSIKLSKTELFPQTLTHFDKPREAINKTFDELDSPNWETNVSALKSMVRLMRYHPETLDNHMHMVCIQLTRSVRNLRSQVSRAACQLAGEFFTIKSKFLEQECDDLVGALLHRTADTNRFLRADANRGLESMCDNLNPPKVLNVLTRGAMHQNAVVRSTTAKLLNRLADRLGCEKIFTMGRDNRDKFFLTGANLLLEGSLETRSHAKSLFRLLSDHPNYGKVLLEVIPKRTYRNIEKTLKSIR